MRIETNLKNSLNWIVFEMKQNFWALVLLWQRNDWEIKYVFLTKSKELSELKTLKTLIIVANQLVCSICILHLVNKNLSIIYWPNDKSKWIMVTGFRSRVSSAFGSSSQIFLSNVRHSQWSLGKGVREFGRSFLEVFSWRNTKNRFYGLNLTNLTLI